MSVATIDNPRRTAERVDLAHADDFALGAIAVRPSTREIAACGKVLVLEPRVMQVLVALHVAQGGIVSRDDLIARCWDGRIVGDDAINRVLSRLRRVADEIGGGGFRIETITKVGYRLVEPGAVVAGAAAPADLPSAPLGRRRALLALACAAGTATLGAGVWFTASWRNRPNPEVAALMKQAEFALHQDTREGQNQALGLYRRAVAIQPDSADAWGALAVTYATAAKWRPAREAPGMRARAREAVQRAQQLDPGNSYAAVAQAYSAPVAGSWFAAEQALRRATAQHPESGILAFALGGLLCSVGRAGEASRLLARLRQKGGTAPGLYFREVLTLWGSDQLEAADRLLKEARELYPTHFALWFADCYIRLHSGRASSALAMIEDVDNRPTGIPAKEFDDIAIVAKGLINRDPATIDAATRFWTERAHHGAGYAENAIQFATALGRIDDAFRIAEAYYFGRGFSVPEVRFSEQQGSYTPMDERQTSFLFYGSLTAFRADPRFDRLTDEVGLKAYWAQSGSTPDFLAR